MCAAVLFMFLEVVLDWRALWFKLLWRDCLELYIALSFAIRITPTPANYAIHFQPLRPSPTAPLAPGAYARFFRWLLESSVDIARADAAVARDAAAREAAGRAAPSAG